MAFGLRIRRVALIAGALAAATAAHAEPKLKPAKPFRIGLEDAAIPRGVTGLKKGGALFCYAAGDDVFVRPVDGKGKAKTPVSLRSAGRSDIGVSQAKIAELSNGDVAAVWVGRPEGRSTVFVRVVKPDGKAVSAEKPASNDDLSLTRVDVSVAALPGAKFAVAWRDVGVSGETFMRLRVYDAAGAPQNLTTSITAPAGVRFVNPYVAPLGKGFVLVYAQAGDANAIYAQIYKPTALADDGPFRLDRPNDRTPQIPRVTALGKGGAAVIWRENELSDVVNPPIVVDTRLKGVFLDDKGKAGQGFALDDKIIERSLESSVSLADTGDGLLVAWTVGTPAGGADADVRGALVAPSGKAGAVTTLTKAKDRRESGPEIATMKDGRVALAYSLRNLETDDARQVGAFGTYLDVKGK